MHRRRGQPAGCYSKRARPARTDDGAPLLRVSAIHRSDRGDCGQPASEVYLADLTLQRICRFAQGVAPMGQPAFQFMLPEIAPNSFN